MNQLVTVIVPVYKAKGFIERCANSLFAQTYQNIEFFFVNDCTPDESIELLENSLLKYPKRKSLVNIINLETNQGHAHARNVALKQCRGEYVIQIDADDWVEPNMIEEMLGSAIENDAEIVACDFIKEYKDHNEYWSVNAEDIGHEGLRNFKWKIEYSAHWNKLVKTSIIKDNNIYCIEGTNNWVDIGQIVPLRFIAKKISVLNKAFYHYNAFNENSVSRHTTEKRIADIIKTANVVYNFVHSRSDKSYEVSLCFLLFQAKSILLRPDINQYHRWRNTFPRSNQYIFMYPRNILLNFLYWLAAHGIYFPLKIVKGYKYYINKVFAKKK